MSRAVIFDMGGTLMRFVGQGNATWPEFEAPGIRGIYQYLVEQGHPMACPEDVFIEAMFTRLAEGWAQSISGHISLRAVDWIAGGLADYALTLDGVTLLEAARRYAQPLREGISSMPGTVETLEVLRQRGYRIGLISNTFWPAELLLKDLEVIGVLPYLDQLTFSGEFGVWKPNPRIFLHTLEALGTMPAQVTFIGDNPREDILGAQAVGMRAIWLRSEIFSLGDIQPDAIISSIPELLPILQSWDL